jgi:hypothetical protein
MPIDEISRVEINKYSPRVFRTNIFDDWTSCSQIAEGKVTKEQYLRVEDKYVSAIERVAGTQPLLVARNVESWELEDALLSQVGLDDVLTNVEPPSEDQPIDPARLENVIRRCLREVAWMEIGCPRELMIHFGYDLRIVVVSASDLTPQISKIREEDGLFVYESRANLETTKGWFPST